jgi:hypothetical protein
MCVEKGHMVPIDSTVVESCVHAAKSLFLRRGLDISFRRAP